jgi:hypothetical protein
MVTCSMVHHWHLCGHHENFYATDKSVFSSLPPYHMLLQAFIMSLNEICVAKPKTLSSHIVLELIFSTNSWQSLTTMPKTRKLILKWCHKHYELLTPKYPAGNYVTVGAFHGILPHVANVDNQSATVLIYECSLLCNNIPIATHTRNSTAPSLLWYGLVNSAQQRTAFSNDPTGVLYWVHLKTSTDIHEDASVSDYTANCRPVLSSERAPNRYKTANFRQQHSDRK